MRTIFPEIPVIRSLLFVPGHLPQMAAKASRMDADAIVLDLEDAVPVKQKTAARPLVGEILQSGLFGSTPVFVRVNPREDGTLEQELNAVVGTGLDGIVYPGTESAEDIQILDRLLTDAEARRDISRGTLSILPLCETPLGILKCENIARASKRNIALVFGCEDYLAALEGRHDADESALLLPRSMLAMTARAYDLQPIDAPFVRVRDLEGLDRFAQAGYTLGMSGMVVLTPLQVELINGVYTPANEELQQAREIIAAADNEETSDRGVFLKGSTFISPPTVKAARALIERYEKLKRCGRIDG